MTSNPPCRLNLEKAIQASGVILRQEGNTASRIRLLKLLYITERRSIERFGRPLLGAKVVAMKHGPLHSELLDLIHGEHVGESRWASFFENRGIRVAIAVQPDVGLLSRGEIELLEEVAKEFADLDEWEIVDHTHGFPEWQKHYPDPRENTSRPIPMEDIVAAVGRGAEAPAIVEQLTSDAAFDRFFAGLLQ